jgi:hypothetical protein
MTAPTNPEEAERFLRDNGPSAVEGQQAASRAPA